MKTHVISDLHFGHEKIVQYERPEFRTIDNHDFELIHRWNQRVGDEDVVYILGDFCFDSRKVKSYTEKLRGKKILILGNHDSSKLVKNPSKFGFDAVHAFGLDLKKVSLCHYYMPQHRRKFMLHGHEHRVNFDGIRRFKSGTDRERLYWSMNVCVENHNYYPIELDRALGILTAMDDNHIDYKLRHSDGARVLSQNIGYSIPQGLLTYNNKLLREKIDAEKTVDIK